MVGIFGLERGDPLGGALARPAEPGDRRAEDAGATDDGRHPAVEIEPSVPVVIGPPASSVVGLIVVERRLRR